jgi:hypothetical protein
MRPNANELVNRAQRAHDRPVFNGNVAAECGAVSQDYAISDHAVMRDVRVSHNQRVVADTRQPTPFRGPAANGDGFADHVVVANLETGGLARVTQILGRHAHGRKRKKAVARADRGRPFDGYVGEQLTIFSDFDLGPDHTIWANLAGRMDFSEWADNGGDVDVGWVDLCLGHSLRFMISVGLAQPSAFFFLGIVASASHSTRAIHKLAGHDSVRDALIANVCSARHTHCKGSRRAAPGFYFHFQPQLITGNYRTPETGLLDSRKYHQFLAAVLHLGK